MLLSRVVQIMGAAIADEGGELPSRLCTAYSEALEGHGASLALMADLTHHRTLAASGPEAAALGQLEFDLGEGPGLEAVAQARPVLVGDLTGPDARRWPVWSATVVSRGLPARAVFAHPLRIDHAVFGVVELFRDRPGTLDEVDAATAGITSDLTALALARSLDLSHGVLDAPAWLQDPMLDEVEVDQAVGMVMAQLRAPADTALDMLRARAFSQSRTLGDVARDVLSRKIVFEPGETGRA